MNKNKSPRSYAPNLCIQSFEGISIVSLSVQLNIGIETLKKDIFNGISTLASIGLLSIINQTFPSEIDQTLSHETSSDIQKLNLCHLFALMMIYGCKIWLFHISKMDKLLLFSNKNKTKNENNSKNNSSMIDIDLIQLFQNKCISHSNAMTHLNNKNPILLYYGPTTTNCCEQQIKYPYNIAIRNEMILTQCSKIWNNTNEKCNFLKKIEKQFVISAKKHSNDMRSQIITKNKINYKRNLMIIKPRDITQMPVSILPKFHDQNLHKKFKRKGLTQYSMHEIEKHKSKESCWIIVDGLVLDVTKFLPYHPGHYQCILKNAGKICDKHWEMHSKKGRKLFMKFVIGRVEKDDGNNNNKIDFGDCLIQ